MVRYALRFILYDKPKSIGVVLGIIISTFLVGQQTGIFLFLTNAMSALIDNTDAAIWVVDSRTTNCNALDLIDTRVGRQIESLNGVRKSYALVITGGLAKFKDGTTAPVSIIGAQVPELRGGPFRIHQGEAASLIREGAVSVDYFDRKILNNASLGTKFEINGKRVIVTLQTRGARGFGATYTYTTLPRARFLGDLPKTKVSAYLVTLKDGADSITVRDEINRSIYGIKAWLKDDFSRATVSTVLSTSGIAFSIGSLIIFAIISGIVIIGLTMYSAAVERLRDYGTLKAVGASNSTIRRLILTQALLFALTGYGSGILLLEFFRKGIANSGVLFDYSLAIKIGFFCITMFISLGGAAFAMRRISKLEPASVFRT
jgi:putative ABC transport system permease protein